MIEDELGVVHPGRNVIHSDDPPEKGTVISPLLETHPVGDLMLLVKWIQLSWNGKDKK